MKKVFDNAMCAHVWAQQSQSEGRTNNGNMFFEGRTIYSYGRHFPIATFYKGRVIYNADSYSMSTSGHQSDVRRAIGYDTPVIKADTRTIKFFADYYNDSETADKLLQDHFKDYAMNEAKKFLESAAKRKKGHLAESDINYAYNAIGNAENFFALFDIGLPEELAHLKTQIENNRDNILAAFKQDLAVRKAKEKETAKYEAKLAEEAAEMWRVNSPFETHHHNVAFNRSKYIYMRLKGGDIETSRGATFPQDHGIKAFKFIRECREQKREFITNGKTIHLGHFRIDKIDTRGNVKAGCHYVEWAEIERMAVLLKIYP